MKKLLMAVAIVCAAAGAQAAALSWATWGYTLSEGSTGEEVWGAATTTAYLIHVTDTATFAVASDLAITGGTIVNYTADAGDGTLSGAWNTDTLADGVNRFAILVTSKPGTGLTPPTDGFYGVDKNGGNATDFYEVTWNSGTGGSFGADDAFYGVGATTAVVPEPTSGLLLLLGMAGLALKRKRA